MPQQLGTRRNVPYKVIDTWIYKVKDVEFDREEFVKKEENREDDQPSSKYKMGKARIKNKTVKVELRMEKTTKQSEEAPHPLDTVKLEVYCGELDARLEGTDIECLRAAMWAMLDKHYEIKWERYYLVEVKQQRPYSADGTGLVFSYKDIHKGTTWDGKVLMKIYRGGSYGNSDRIEPWPGEFKDTGGNVIACIPDNEMNEAALKEFSRRIDVLRAALADFLTPEKIVQTLANMSGFALLPPAPPAPPKKDG